MLLLVMSSSSSPNMEGQEERVIDDLGGVAVEEIDVSLMALSSIAGAMCVMQLKKLWKKE